MKIAIVAGVALLAAAGAANAQSNMSTDAMSHGQMSNGTMSTDAMNPGQTTSGRMRSHKKSRMSYGAMSDSMSTGNTTGH